jgi:acyl carrier protein
MTDDMAHRLIVVLPDHVRSKLSGLSFAEISSLRLDDIGVSSLETVEMIEALEESIGAEFEVEELLDLTELPLGELAERVDSKARVIGQSAKSLSASDG